MTKAVNEGQIEGIRVRTTSPCITHLFFADDALLFLIGTQLNLIKLKRILDAYCLASGQLANYDKSPLYFNANTLDFLKLICCDCLNINPHNKPGNYLGIPTLWEGSKYKVLVLLKDKIDKKMQGQKSTFLSTRVKKY